MEVAPADLMRFGDRYELPEAEGRRHRQVVTLSALAGPPLNLGFGILLLADPWWPESVPNAPAFHLGPGGHPTTFSTITFELIRHSGDVTPVTMVCAATIGDLGRVASWQPLLHGGTPFLLDIDSALGAFCDPSDAPRLQRLFEDNQHMLGVYTRALEENVVPIIVEGRPAAVAFLAPDGASLYPAYAGLDASGAMAAVLVDLLILGGDTPRVE